MRKRISVIILAAGKGSRMNSTQKKQFMELDHKPVLYYCLEAFQQSDIDEIVLVTAKEDEDYCRKEIVEKYGITKVVAYATGGSERFQSVRNGLDKATGEVCMIHDGARPFPPRDAIAKLCELAQSEKAVILGVPVKDTIKRIDEKEQIVETPARDSLMAAQTPQMFDKTLLMKCYESMEKEKDLTLNITDDAMIVERYGNAPVFVVMGSYTNLKITTPEDLEIAENMRKRNCL